MKMKLLCGNIVKKGRKRSKRTCFALLRSWFDRHRTSCLWIDKDTASFVPYRQGTPRRTGITFTFLIRLFNFVVNIGL